MIIPPNFIHSLDADHINRRIIMWTIGLGFIGFILIMCGYVFETSGPAYLGFILVVFGVIIDIGTNIEPKRNTIHRDVDIHL